VYEPIGRALLRRRALVLATVSLLILSVVHARTALAETMCDRTEEDGYSTLTVTIGVGQTVAVRFFGSTVDVSDDVNAEATDFLPQQEDLDSDCIQQPDIERLVINGTDDGAETLKVIEWGTTGKETPGSDVQSTVDLAGGDDTLEFMSADTNDNGVADSTSSIFLALGTAAEGGATVVDQGPTVEGNFMTDCVDTATAETINSNGVAFDCSDLIAMNSEHIVITGGTDAHGDAVDAQGDFDDGFIDVGTLGVLDDGDPFIPGTADHEGLDADGGLDNDDNEPNGGNLEAALTANLNAGPDAIAPGDGNDTIEGAGGKDLIDYAEAGDAVQVNLAGGVAAGGSNTDSISSFQGATGSVFDDRMRGSKGRNLLNGYCGTDVIVGRGKKDVLEGEVRTFFRAFVCAEIAGEEDDPTDALPVFASGDDKISGGGGGDLIRGRKGDDSLRGHGGKDGLNGGAGSDKGNGGPQRDRCRKLERERSCER
jgi:Ca2+-binding RTX toxin-like protein